MRKKMLWGLSTAIAIVVVLFFLGIWFLWYPTSVPKIGPPVRLVVNENGRVLSRTTLPTTSPEYKMLVKWLECQSTWTFSRCFASCLPGVVVDCPECEINFQYGIHDDVILSIKDKDNPNAGWSQFYRKATAEDEALRGFLMDAAKRIARLEATGTNASATEPPANAGPRN
jgi:hypothetical protein